MSGISFEEVLERDGKLVYSIRGVSMLPMLRQDRDLVVIRPAAGRADAGHAAAGRADAGHAAAGCYDASHAAAGRRLRPFDVAFYRRGEKYVLHRVISVTDGGYLTRGDNTYTLERVPEEQVLGVLTSFLRDGREYDVTDPRYLMYVRLWCAAYGLRAGLVRCRRLCARVFRCRGLLARVARVLKRIFKL